MGSGGGGSCIYDNSHDGVTQIVSGTEGGVWAAGKGERFLHL